MKKIEKAQLFLKENLHLFQCPVCQSSFKEITDFQLSCLENHQFDLSKKGTLHFLLKPVQSEYTREMLLARQRIAQGGFWHPMLEEVFKQIKKLEGTHLDVGCGEGAHSHYLKGLGLSGPTIAFDISKEGIQLGAATYEDLFFLVADLAHSPFSGNSFDTILNILSPSNYKEFKRLLKPEGQVIKVVPGTDYLKELRTLSGTASKRYSNKDVVRKFEEEFPNHNKIPVYYTRTLNDEEIVDFIHMTPLGWHVQLDEEMKKQLKTITIDMVILVGENK